MRRIATDFNNRTPEGFWCQLKSNDGLEFDDHAERFQIKIGEPVILYDNEIEISAVLDFRFIEAFGKKIWIAYASEVAAS